MAWRIEPRSKSQEQILLKINQESQIIENKLLDEIPLPGHARQCEGKQSIKCQTIKVESWLVNEVGG